MRTLIRLWGSAYVNECADFFYASQWADHVLEENWQLLPCRGNHMAPENKSYPVESSWRLNELVEGGIHWKSGFSFKISQLVLRRMDFCEVAAQDPAQAWSYCSWGPDSILQRTHCMPV